MNRNSYFIDHINKEIKVTNNFMKKAGVLNTEEYRIFKLLREDNPGYEIKLMTVASNKKAYKTLTIDKMHEFITLKDGAESETMKTFETVYTEAKVRGNAYPRVKSWFLSKYKDYADAPNWDDTNKDNAENKNVQGAA